MHFRAYINQEGKCMAIFGRNTLSGTLDSAAVDMSVCIPGLMPGIVCDCQRSGILRPKS